MKFALIDNIKTTATKGAKGLCPCCGSELIAKCGDIKVHHWAHKGNRNCDPWWENETEWHRAWKSNFPNEWQEVILTDEKTGEKHIADICSTFGHIVEFQHSHIDPLERKKREYFYKKMIWVVDGTKLKRDYARFFEAKKNFRRTNKQGHFFVDSIEKCFPASWIGSSVPVIFDFKGTELISDPNDLRNYLYYLYPKSGTGESVVAIVSRQTLIQGIISGDLLKEKQPINLLTNLETQRRQSNYYYDGPRGRMVRRKRL